MSQQPQRKKSIPLPPQPSGMMINPPNPLTAANKKNPPILVGGPDKEAMDPRAGGKKCCCGVVNTSESYCKNLGRCFFCSICCPIGCCICLASVGTSNFQKESCECASRVDCVCMDECLNTDECLKVCSCRSCLTCTCYPTVCKFIYEDACGNIGKMLECETFCCKVGQGCYNPCQCCDLPCHCWRCYKKDSCSVFYNGCLCCTKEPNKSVDKGIETGENVSYCHCCIFYDIDHPRITKISKSQRNDNKIRPMPNRAPMPQSIPMNDSIDPMANNTSFLPPHHPDLEIENHPLPQITKNPRSQQKQPTKTKQ